MPTTAARWRTRLSVAITRARGQKGNRDYRPRCQEKCGWAECQEKWRLLGLARCPRPICSGATRRAELQMRSTYDTLSRAPMHFAANCHFRRKPPCPSRSQERLARLVKQPTPRPVREFSTNSSEMSRQCDQNATHPRKLPHHPGWPQRARSEERPASLLILVARPDIWSDLTEGAATSKKAEAPRQIRPFRDGQVSMVTARSPADPWRPAGRRRGS